MKNPEEKSSPAIDQLLQKLDDSPGFAGVAGIAQAIRGLVDDDANTGKVVEIILCDPALTAKLLQMANYTERTISGRNVSTIDQALSILGPGKIKSLAAELTPIESLPNKSQLSQLRAEIMAAFFAGHLAAEITRANGSQYSAREAQVCGLLQNLGRMMSMLYLYEEIERSHKLQAEQNITENEAVAQILGVGFEDIGAAIVHHWGLSIIVQNSLAPDTLLTPPAAVPNAMGWYRLCSLFCRRIARVLFYLPENSRQFEIVNCIDFFQKALHLREKEVLDLIEKCLLDTDATLSGMNFPCNVEQARSLLRKSSERTTDILLQYDPLVKNGGNDVAEIPIESIKRIMRLVHGHCSFDCTLVCLPLGSGLIAIAGVGRDAAWLTTRFRSSGLKPDIFRKAMSDSHDIFVPDVGLPEYARLIPDWYRDTVGAKSFVMLPLLSEGKWLGMIYGDYSEPHPEAPPGLAEGRMLGWRNELVQILLQEADGIATRAAEPWLQLLHQDHEYGVDARYPSLKIGRAEGADIVVEDPQASRMHATIAFRQGKFIYTDLSSNGSFMLIRGQPEVRVHRKEFELRGEGSICLGHPHKQGAREYLEFFCQGGDEEGYY